MNYSRSTYIQYWIRGFSHQMCHGLHNTCSVDGSIDCVEHDNIHNTPAPRSQVYISKQFSFIADNAVPGSAQVPPWAEEEVSLRGPVASSAGAVLHSRAPPTAVHHGDENEEYVDEGQSQGRRRRWNLCTGAWVSGNQTTHMEPLRLTLSFI